jgi:hypothetical protein
MSTRKAHEAGLDAAMKVRLSRADLERLREDADVAALSVSELVRRRYFGRPIIAHADLVMVRELRRQGGLLKVALAEHDVNEVRMAARAVRLAIERVATLK